MIEDNMDNACALYVDKRRSTPFLNLLYGQLVHFELNIAGPYFQKV